MPLLQFRHICWKLYIGLSIAPCGRLHMSPCRGHQFCISLHVHLGCRARKLGLGGKVHCMLALQTGLTAPPSFRLHRPATGRAAKILKLDELTLRCVLHQGDERTCQCQVAC